MSKKVFIGVGHGGRDPGAVGNGLKEKDLTLGISKACAAELQRHGVEVMLSRHTDVSENLSQRIKEAKAFKPDVAVDNHVNAGGGKGAEVYHSAYNTNDDALAKAILEEVVKVGLNNRGLKTKLYGNTDYFGFIRQLSCPSVLTEFGFIDSTDAQFFDTPTELKKLGVAEAKGILRCLGIAYKEPTAPKPPKPANSFFPARGYFKKGDVSPNVGKVATFMRKVFPSYTSEKALGNLYGDNLIKAITEFQRRTGLKPDGYLGPKTLEMLKKYGFKA